MNLEEIKELIRVFGRSKLDKLKIKDGEFEIALQKENKVSQPNVVAPAAIENNISQTQPNALPHETATQEQKEVAINQDEEIITSPMVGTFYAAPSPDSPPFVNVGDTVRKGQTLCILEAMKIMNELEAEFDCKILEILVQDGQPVEYDTPLFRVERL